jgi:very-short-patch-repair endonuclease
MSLNIKSKLVPLAKARCRELRKKQTKAEQVFWDYVRNRKYHGFKFYRQYPVFFDMLGKETFYIADFYCPEKRIIVELDGDIHEKQKEQDKLRDSVIAAMGIKVIRFKNVDIIKDIDDVLGKIRNVI